MRNKGAIQLVAILFAVFSLFHLSFTWVTRGVESDAKEYAQGDVAKELAYLDSMANEEVYFLGLKNFTYREAKERELNFGLDLKGGMNVTLEVSVVELVKTLSSDSQDTTFTAAIRKAQEYQKKSQDDFITLFARSMKEVAPNAQLSAFFSSIKLKGRVAYDSKDEEVIAVLREEAQSAIDNSFNILRTRIDRFGVSQPNIQRLGLESSGRVLVELPGIKDPERVRKLLQGSANLEFWETYDNREVYNFLIAANDEIAKQNEAKEIVKESVATTDSTGVVESDSTKVDNSLVNELKTDSLTAGKEDMQKRFPLFSLLQPSIAQNGQPFQGATVGTAHIKDTAKIMSYLKNTRVKELFPRELKLAWEVKTILDKDKKPTSFVRLVALKGSKRNLGPVLEGDVIADARQDLEPMTGESVVSMSMTGDGAAKWSRITGENIGKQVAIVLDNYVYSYPVVNGQIKGGSSQISGNFSIQEAKDLANILKSGKLPAPTHIIQEEVVGPSLGRESIQSGLVSFIIAFVVVLIYMIFYYNKSGWVANIALITNVFFIFGVLSSLNAVLTLPGIAGIVLTIGMSVDANVLIFERIREEILAGKGVGLSISDGYKHAYSAIIDANLTTLFTAIILYVFGSGPVQGFATTLVIGILTSLFAAIFITRMIFETMLKRKSAITFSTKLTEGAFKNLNIDFLGKRKLAYTISGAIIALGLISLVFQGLNLGVDFKGGRTYVVRYEKDVNTQDLTQALDAQFGDSPEIKTFGSNNQVKITTDYKIDEEGQDIDREIEQKLYAGSKALLDEGVTFEQFSNDYRMSSHKVGPTIADDIKWDATIAIAFSLLIIFLYILFRFRGRQFGFGAVAALAHDVLVVLGLFSILYNFMPFSMEIDQAFIAAILTVIGYSINDTVVVFDRIREYVALHKKDDKVTVYNSALNSTLSRTFSTSLSTFVVLLTIFMFGGASLRGFIFALLVGVVVGTYSSLFIATPVAFDTLPEDKKGNGELKPKKAKVA